MAVMAEVSGGVGVVRRRERGVAAVVRQCSVTGPVYRKCLGVLVGDWALLNYNRGGCRCRRHFAHV